MTPSNPWFKLVVAIAALPRKERTELLTFLRGLHGRRRERHQAALKAWRTMRDRLR